MARLVTLVQTPQIVRCLFRQPIVLHQRAAAMAPTGKCAITGGKRKYARRSQIIALQEALPHNVAEVLMTSLQYGRCRNILYWKPQAHDNLCEADGSILSLGDDVAIVPDRVPWFDNFTHAPVALSQYDYARVKSIVIKRDVSIFGLLLLLCENYQ